MYRIMYGSDILYDPRSVDHHVLDPQITLGVNIAGSAQLTLLKTHPRYNTPQLLQPVLEVLDDAEILFRGRIILQEKLSIFDEKRLTAEGMLACLNDSVIEPFEFPAQFETDAAYQAAAESGNVVQYFLQWILNRHNAQVGTAQQLQLGTVTVSDPNNYILRLSENYQTAWEIVKGKLFESELGGYMYCRYESTGTYVDYVEEFTQTAQQQIRFAENLVNITQNIDGSNTYSVVLPLGVKDEETGQRLTIEALPDQDITSDIVKEGKFLYSKSAVQKYGKIVAPIKDTTFDDITIGANLQTRGARILGQYLAKINVGTAVQAIDLHWTENQIRAFRPYRNVMVKSEPNGIDTSLSIIQITYNLTDPLASLLQLGKNERTLTGEAEKQNMDTDRVIESMERDVQGLAAEINQINDQITEQSTSIIQDAQQIILSALESYVTTQDYDAFKESISTTLRILSDQVELNFVTSTQQIGSVDGALQDFINEQVKYIRFIDGNIVLGEEGNEFVLKLENERISFLQNDTEIAYFANYKIHAADGEFETSVSIGNFQWVYLPDGSFALV